MTWSIFFAWYIAIPWLVAACFAVIACAFIPGAARVTRVIDRALRWLGHTAWRGPLVVAGVSLILALIPIIPGRAALAEVHDEISYLLMADTFLHGRLTNPSPPMWEHFQTFHELMTPTYASKFPVGQGIALAIGTVLGTPRIGAFGAVVLACAAVCWMAMAALPRRWAVVCGLLAAVQPVIFSWGQSFWGGGVAMLGAALLCGAALRIARPLSRRSTSPITLRDGMVLGVGGAILMNSRPFEGALLSLIVGGCLLVCAARRHSIAPLFRRAVGPAVIVVLPVLAWMLYYNHRVTGHALEMPYAEHAKQYMVGPLFWWQDGHPERTNVVPRIQWFHQVFELKEWSDQRTFGGFLAGMKRKMQFVPRDATSPLPLTVCATAGGLLAMWRRRIARLAGGLVAIFLLLHMCITPWLRIQYLAVIAPPFLLLVTAGLRELNTIGRRRSKRRAARSNVFRRPRWPIGTAAVVSLVLMLPVYDLISVWNVGANPTMASAQRDLIDQLSQRGGKNLVCVNYTGRQESLYEWVHNSADIEAQQTIFAHAINMEGIDALHAQFPDRAVWLLEISGVKVTMQLLIPASASPGEAAPPASEQNVPREPSDFHL